MGCEHLILTKLVGPIENAGSYKCQECGELMTVTPMEIVVHHGKPPVEGK